MLDFLIFAGFGVLTIAILAFVFRPKKQVEKDDSEKAPYKIEPPTLEVVQEPEVKATPKKRVYKKKVKENLDV